MNRFRDQHVLQAAPRTIGEFAGSNPPVSVLQSLGKGRMREPQEPELGCFHAYQTPSRRHGFCSKCLQLWTISWFRAELARWDLLKPCISKPVVLAEGHAVVLCEWCYRCTASVFRVGTAAKFPCTRSSDAPGPLFPAFHQALILCTVATQLEVRHPSFP